MGQLLIFFLCKFCSCFSCGGAVLITSILSVIDGMRIFDNFFIFFICIFIFSIFSTALEELTPYLHNTTWLKQPQSHLHYKNPYWKQTIFAVLMYSLYGLSRNFTFEISTICPVYPDYLSISYDYDQA